MKNKTASPVGKKTTSLVEDFQEYFDLELAKSPEQLESVYRIRYRVYCEEFGYESADAFPDQLETDEFDSKSSHCLVTHKLSGLPAGCARLVHADEQSQMPMEKFCGSAIDEKILRSFDGRRDTICEFSRLGVDGAFRRRAGEHLSRFGEISALDCTKREQRTFSLIAVSTILAAFAMSDLVGKPHCFAMMEPFLPRLLKRSGIIVHPAGEQVEYHGVRGPYYFETHETVGGMVEEMREFYTAIRAGFVQSGSLEPNGTIAKSSGERLFNARPSWWTPFIRPGFAL
jgi:N-acyl amino acid synthase of PEP-CTERM/exosortase system